MKNTLIHDFCINRRQISLGLPTPVTFLHMSDSHLLLVDNEDGEEQHLCFAERTDWAGDSPDMIKRAVSYAKEKSLPILHTGDLFDFVTHANIAFAKEVFADTDLFITPGNHEFYPKVSHEVTYEEAFAKNFTRVQACHKTPLLFASKVLGGVNFVALNDGNYQISSEQLAFLKSEVEKGLPIVLMMHVPIYTQGFANHVLATGEKIVHLLGVPEEVLATYPEAARKEIAPTEDTRRAIEYIQSTPAIRLLLTGHQHLPFDDVLPSGTPQIVHEATYLGSATEVTLI